MKKNLLVTLADKNYIEQAKQLFSSVYWNAGWKGDYMLLAHEIPEKDLKWFRDKGILIKKCKPLWDKHIGENKHPCVVVTKFYLFTPEFKKWKNVIYLDADIIVRASLDELTKVKGVAAVPDFYFSKLENQFRNITLEKKRLFKEIKEDYNLDRLSFNAGVIVFNTNIIQKDNIIRLNNLLKKYVSISGWGEQTILNLFFNRNWKRLPSVYNIYLNDLQKKLNFKSEKIKGIILHFIMKDKPWSKKNPFYNEWKTNLEKSDLIDLKKVQESKKWTKFEVYRYPIYLKMRRISHIFYQGYKKLKSDFIYLIHTPERLLGKFGIFLRKYNPNLYHKLKKIEKKIRR